jgi:hypothetical protein
MKQVGWWADNAEAEIIGPTCYSPLDVKREGVRRTIDLRVISATMDLENIGGRTLI